MRKELPLPYKEENIKLLKKELEKKNITIKTNLYYDRRVRSYYVKEVVVEERLTKESRLELGFRLVNDALPKETQIFLALPNTKIEKRKEDKQTVLVLRYEKEMDMDRDFELIARAKLKQDLEIYIYY